MFRLEELLKTITKYLSFKILKKSLTAETWNGIWQFIQFAIIGLSNTIINYVVYVILLYLGMNYILANILGFFVSVVNAFYWNNYWVFKKKDNEERQFLKTLFKTFMTYAGTGLILNNILLVIWVRILGISTMRAPILNLLITVPTNFILNKFWTFTTERQKKE